MGGTQEGIGWGKPEGMGDAAKAVEITPAKAARVANNEDEKGTFKFPGLAVNNNDEGPKLKQKKSMPWRPCFSDKWIQRKTWTVFNEENNPDMPILNIAIPESLFTDDDAAWLADEEDVGDEEE
ncbi:hypothetical protein EVG20_g748 [Dentipellis fragilis]|uniref:Uncharacterized protein n=1 Tax=Dentipellis fragilis TaxID=205917 RepID=A0A4Y9ZBS0_9AGAM|nr:hypothetical protein EVG20_g748 [Dentipellis fragilis]